MKKIFLVVIIILSYILTGCSGFYKLDNYDNIKMVMTQSNLTRNGCITNKYPKQINFESIKNLPVFRIINEKMDLREESLKNIAKYLNIDINKMERIKHEPTESDYFTDTPYEFGFSYQNDTYNSKDLYSLYMDAFSYEFFLWNNGENPELVKIYNLNYNYEFIGNYDYLTDVISFNKSDTKILIESFENYISDNNELFSEIYEFSEVKANRTTPYPAYYIENENKWIYNPEAVVSFDIDVFFREKELVSSEDILLDYNNLNKKIIIHFKLLDNKLGNDTSIADYPADNFTEIGRYNIIPYSEAVKRFDNDDDINYQYADTESVKGFDVYLVYVEDKDGYIRPIYLKQSFDSVGSFGGSAWFDAIDYNK